MKTEAFQDLKKFLDSDDRFDKTSLIAITSIPEEESVKLQMMYSKGESMEESEAIAVDTVLSGLYYGAMSNQEQILKWYLESMSAGEVMH